MSLEVGETYKYKGYGRTDYLIFRVIEEKIYGYMVFITKNSMPYLNEGKTGEIFVARGSLVDEHSILVRNQHPLTKIFEN